MQADDSNVVRDLIARLRQEIDGIDNKIITLVQLRTEVSAQIARLKRAHNIPIVDGKRELEIFSRYRVALGQIGKTMAGALLSKSKSPTPEHNKSSPVEDAG